MAGRRAIAKLVPSGRRDRRLLAALIAAGVVAINPAAATEIGAISAATPVLEGEPPAAQRRVLAEGERVFADERILSSPQGVGQILFDDGSTLTVSPGADLKLSKYIYDPNSGVGEITLSMTKGALRFIGGAITKTTPATVETPFATIGIRGGMALIEADPEEGVGVILLAGESATIDAGDGEMVLARPNAKARVSAGSERAEFTGLADAEALDAILSQFERPPGLAPDTALSDSDIDESGVSIFVSGALGAVSAAPISTSGGSAGDTGLFDPFVVGGEFTLETLDGATLTGIGGVPVGGVPVGGGPGGGGPGGGEGGPSGDTGDVVPHPTDR